jgi:hypothetical protein
MSDRKSMTLRRDYDAARANSIVNHPDVRPFVLAPKEGDLDLGPVLGDLNNVALMTDLGGLIFLYQAPMVYEVHTQFLPSGRGEFALTTTREAVRWMFSRSDAIELWTKVPEENKAALGLVRAMKGRLEFTYNNVGHFVMRYSDWAHSDPSNRLRGVWFRELLEAKLAVRGSNAPELLRENATSDSAIGATIATIRGGQLDKAILFYDRWAKFAQAPALGLVARWPVTLSLGNGLLVVFNEDASSFDLEIVRCQ